MENESITLRALVYAMVGVFALALIFFLIPTLGLVLLGIGLAAAVPLVWLRWRRLPGADRHAPRSGSPPYGDRLRTDASRDYERRRSA